MASTINADDGVVSGSAGVKTTPDASGVLALQTNGTTAISISTTGQSTFTAANMTTPNPTSFGFNTTAKAAQTGSTTGVLSTVNTDATYAGTSVIGVYANQGTFTVAPTSAYGFYISSGWTGATNNYGYYSNIASGANRYNFYAAGTAENYFEGGTTFNGGITVTQDVQTFNSSGTWTKPAFGNWVLIQMWGGGGGGSRSSANVSQPGAGGGGGYVEFTVPIASMGATATVTVGAAGTGRTASAGVGTNGGNSAVTLGNGSIVYVSGGLGAVNDAFGGKGGYGSIAFSTTAVPATIDGTGGYGSAAAGDGYSYSGAGGGGPTNTAGGKGGYGGGGGTRGTGAGGTSLFGGAGGNASGAGTQPGGGGGCGNAVNTNATNGGAGRVVITTF